MPFVAATLMATITSSGAACSGNHCDREYFRRRLTWLPLTTLDPKHFVDHHLLFHGFQIPFTWFGDLRSGRKDLGDDLRQRGGLFLLLAAGSLPDALLVGLAARVAGLFGTVPLPTEHGQGAAVRHHLPGSRDSYCCLRESIGRWFRSPSSSR